MQSNNAGNPVEVKADVSVGSKRELSVIAVVMSVVIVAFFALVGRCFYLQKNLADYYAEKCVIQQRAYLPLEPQRGAILDCRGRVLAASDQIRTIFAEPRIIKEPKEIATRLAPILDMGAHEICRLIVDSNNPGFVALKKDATVAECEAARKIHGIGIQYDWRRQYPTGRLASHIVGFTSKDNFGLAGIEYAFDRDLRGRGARHTFLVDVHRRPLAFCLADEQDDNEMPIHGAGIILTLDATIQQFAREALLKQVQGVRGGIGGGHGGGPAHRRDPGHGDAAGFRSGRDGPDRPEASRGLHEPAADRPVRAGQHLQAVRRGHRPRHEGDEPLRDHLLRERATITAKASGHIGEYRQGFGDLTLREILMNSSNIGMAKIGQRLGATRLYEGLTLFGFGRKVGIELPGEAEGLLRPPGKWTGYSVTRIPFGQEISVTGLQMLRAFCMIANGGRLVHPYMVRSLVRSDGMVVDMRPSTLRVGYIIKPEVARWLVQEALTSVVNDRKGTGARAKLDKWTVFGKTGTAQLAKDGVYQDKAYIASFIAGAPAENPRVVVLISIRRPNVALKKGYTGGTVASPVAAVILEKTLTYLGVPPKDSAGGATAMTASRITQPFVETEDENSW